MVVHSQHSSAPEIRAAALMQTHDGIDVALQEQCHLGIGGEPPVREKDVASAETGAHVIEQRHVMRIPCPQRRIQERAGGKAYHRHKPGHGKTASRFLRSRLRIFRLIPLRVRHGKCRTVGRQDSPAKPEISFSRLVGQNFANTHADLAQQRLRQMPPRLAVAAGVGRQREKTHFGSGGLEPSQSRPAGRIRMQRLPKHTPHHEQRGERRRTASPFHRPRVSMNREDIGVAARPNIEPTALVFLAFPICSGILTSASSSVCLKQVRKLTSTHRGTPLQLLSDKTVNLISVTFYTVPGIPPEFLLSPEFHIEHQDKPRDDGFNITDDAQ